MAVTDDYSFRLTDTGVILNPDSSAMPFVDITKVSGFDSPEFRESIKDHEGADGGFIDAEFEKGRIIELEGIVYSGSDALEDYLDDLKSNWAPSTSSLNLYFKVPNTSERLVLVKPRGVRYDWDSIRRTGQIAVKFSAFAEDPRIYTATEQSTVIAMGGAATDGLAFPFGFPFGFGSQPSDQPTSVTNSGNRSTPPVLTITGPVVNPRVVNDTTGTTMLFTITLTASETLVINMQYRTIKLNGTTNRRSVLDEPNWFFLNPGENLLRYRASAITASTLTVTYRHAWR